MTNNELDNLVESFLSPKPTPKAMELKELFALFDQLKLNEVITPITQMGVSPKAQIRGSEEAYKTEFYTLMQNAIGESLFSTQQGLGAVDSFSSLIDIINSLKGKQTTQLKSSQTIAIITFVEALYDMIYVLQPDNPDVAGKMFERFVAFATKGQVSSQLSAIDPEKAKKLGASNTSIFDLVTQTNEFVSVKLLADFKVTGSINGLYKFLTNTTENFAKIPEKIQNAGKSVTYIVVIKKDENTLVFYAFDVNVDNFISLIGKEKIDKYNNSLDNKEQLVKINAELNRLSKEREEIESSLDNDPSLTSQQFNQLRYRREEILSRQVELSQIEKDISRSKSSSTSFSISLQGAEPFKFNTLWGKELKMTVEQKNIIIKDNKLSFQTNIKSLIDEATAVYYKVNNLLLKMEDENADLAQKTAFGQEAYDSASSLERNILTLTKEKELNVVESDKTT
jgi:hypothetical protein